SDFFFILFSFTGRCLACADYAALTLSHSNFMSGYSVLTLRHHAIQIQQHIGDHCPRRHFIRLHSCRQRPERLCGQCDSRLDVAAIMLLRRLVKCQLIAYPLDAWRTTEAQPQSITRTSRGTSAAVLYGWERERLGDL